MLNLIQFHLTLVSSKSKCLVILPANRRCLNDYVRKCTFYVGDNPIENADSFVHLGHVITNHIADNDDIFRSRNEFNSQVNNVLCFFSKLKSCIVYRLFQSFTVSSGYSATFVTGFPRRQDLSRGRHLLAPDCGTARCAWPPAEPARPVS